MEKMNIVVYKETQQITEIFEVLGYERNGYPWDIEDDIIFPPQIFDVYADIVIPAEVTVGWLYDGENFLPPTDQETQ